MLIIGRKDVTTELIAKAESPVSRCVSTGTIIVFEFDINYLQTVSIQYYYIDRCDLWGFIREINSGISHVRYHFFPTGTTFTQLYVCYRLRPLLC